ncbi:MAG TPA: DNA-formamidopyrimidine glycosylase family protein [Acidimicrobiales bacterium]|jgi:formamidopyrimidine-DNA glycosylase
MPELPEMQALAERLAAALAGARLERPEVIGFSGLKTVRPAPEDLIGAVVRHVSRRGKYLVFSFGDAGGSDRGRVLVHLSQAGRLDLESPVKSTRPRGAVFRLSFDNATAVLVREHGTQRKAGWWVLGPGDEGPLAGLGPEPQDDTFEALVRTSDSTRHVHTLLRDQHVAAGIGRGYADDALNLAGISPFASLRSLSPEARQALVTAVREVLASALVAERERTGGLSDAKLGGRFAVHNRAGQPCPRCGDTLHRVSYESYEVVYCPTCQTAGKILADRRLSRLLR